jgi:hypothetical protein
MKGEKMPFPKINEKETIEAINDPRVGDRFQEMYSFYLYVIAVNGNSVVTMEGSPPVTFPDEGKIKIQTKAEFKERLSSGSGFWVNLEGRNHDVTGWYQKESE